MDKPVKVRGYGTVDSETAKLLREAGEIVIGGKLVASIAIDKDDVYGPPLKPRRKR